jgi:hypothetical protein
LLRRAKACSLNGDHEEARNVCEALLEISQDEPLKIEVNELLELNRKREVAAVRKQKAEFGRFFDR